MAILSAHVTRIAVRIEFDHDTESPQEHDGQWRLYSFCSSHVNYRHPDEFIGIGFRRKLAVGLAFVLDYFEHSGSAWSISGEGMQCPWDTARGAGVLVWEHSPKDIGAKTVEDRARDARIFLEVYNLWANGQCFWYSVSLIESTKDGFERETDTDFSCGGFIGADHLLDDLRPIVADLRKQYPDATVEFTGDCSDIGDSVDA